MRPRINTGLLDHLLQVVWTRHSVIWLSVLYILYGTVSSQKTPVGLGCTFSDHEHVYNVELVPGEHELPCPDTKALKQALKVMGIQIFSLFGGRRVYNSGRFVSD